MKVGIIGTGDVGTALANSLGAAGHEVVLGSRTPDTHDGVHPIQSQQAAAEHGDVVILAVPADVAVDLAETLARVLDGVPLVDTASQYPTATSHDPLAVRVAEAAPRAAVVKAFNIIGANRMTDPVIEGETATMLLAGNDRTAVTTVSRLADDIGFEPVVAGDLEAAGRLEDLARLWIDLSRTHGRDIGFRLLGV
ncbi:MAG: NADPH-dependent F420 reductase [Salinirussus sp.]